VATSPQVSRTPGTRATSPRSPQARAGCIVSVLDIGSRRLAGWDMADHMRTELVADALERALKLRGSLAGAIFHSDRGSPVPLGRVHEPVQPPRGASVGRTRGNVLRQQRGRGLLVEPEARARPPLPLRHAGRGDRGDHLLDQAIQRRSTALEHRVRGADRVGDRVPSPSSPSRITTCPAGGGKLRCITACQRVIHTPANMSERWASARWTRDADGFLE